jgi:glycine cleavage system H protein
MNLPNDLRYTKSHEWVRTESDGTVVVGITDFAQDALGDLVFVDLPAVGKDFAAGDVIAIVESVKAASDIYAPVTGSVAAVNEDLKTHPENINHDAFAAWLFRLKPANAKDVDALLDAATYRAKVESEK